MIKSMYLCMCFSPNTTTTTRSVTILSLRFINICFFFFIIQMIFFGLSGLQEEAVL